VRRQLWVRMGVWISLGVMGGGEVGAARKDGGVAEEGAKLAKALRARRNAKKFECEM